MPHDGMVLPIYLCACISHAAGIMRPLATRYPLHTAYHGYLDTQKVQAGVFVPLPV